MRWILAFALLAGALALDPASSPLQAGTSPEGRGASGGEGRVKGASADQPNVLFIAVDDLNDWIGCLGGHPDAKTPHLDKLAARGVLFTRAYCAAPACNPSRAAIMTGIRPSSSGVYHNNQPWRPVMKDAVTMGEHFRASGYKVCAGGKIYHGGAGDESLWDEYVRPPAAAKGERTTAPTGFGNLDWGPLK